MDPVVVYVPRCVQNGSESLGLEALEEKYCLNYVRFEVFMEVTTKNAVFWDVAPCRLCKPKNPEDVGHMFLRNVGSHKIYTMPHPRRRNYSYLN
jgi:hypothetical protein